MGLVLMLIFFFLYFFYKTDDGGGHHLKDIMILFTIKDSFVLNVFQLIKSYNIDQMSVGVFCLIFICKLEG